MVKKARKSTSKATKPKNRSGMLPGQYRKRSTVYVERLRGADEATRYTNEDMMRTDAYIVHTNRLDGDFTHTVELNGVMMRLPGKVVERLESQKAAITKEAKRDRDAERSAKMKGTRPAFLKDVEEAVIEAERKQDLEGS
jgi:hypothetical protein